jgi:hypothetical protein
MDYPQLLVVSQNEYRSPLIGHRGPEHRSQRAKINAHRLKIPYNEQMDPYLHRLDLYQILIIGDCQLDKSLLIALVER